MNRRRFLVTGLSFLALPLAAGPLPSPARAASGGVPAGKAGFVYVMTNDAQANAILAYRRAADGTLTFFDSSFTGGRGSGGAIDPLVSQVSLTLSDDRRFLFAVNAGSDTVSVFDVRPNGLVLKEVAPSGGVRPISLASNGGRLYVLNANPGGTASVTGFSVKPGSGRLSLLGDSTRFLPSPTSGAANVGVSPDGRTLAVTERTANRITTFGLDGDGVPAGAPVVTPSNGRTPFSLAFRGDGVLVVAEAAGGVPTGAAVSSYGVAPSAALSVITGSAPTGGNAACWIEVTPDGRFAYTTNAGSSTITGFAIGANGALTRVTPAGPTAALPAGSTPLDIAITGDGRYLYNINGAAGTVTGFRIGDDGTLTQVALVTGLPAAAGLNGIAAL
jgi:6-phosphogluconolactonase (cycloisomerase 2 family)